MTNKPENIEKYVTVNEMILSDTFEKSLFDKEKPISTKGIKRKNRYR